jgi:hypothetical protein
VCLRDQIPNKRDVNKNVSAEPSDEDNWTDNDDDDDVDDECIVDDGVQNSLSSTVSVADQKQVSKSQQTVEELWQTEKAYVSRLRLISEVSSLGIPVPLLRSKFVTARANYANTSNV